MLILSKRCLPVSLVLLAFSVQTFAQEPLPSPTPPPAIRSDEQEPIRTLTEEVQ